MFVGREKELAILNKTLKKSGNAVLIYGKRKVGKTTLIKKYLEGSVKSVYFECIKSSLEENVAAMTAELVREGIIPSMITFTSFIDLFAYLNTLDIHLTVVIDEYPYLKFSEDSSRVDSVFQNIIDNRMKNISLIISGSHVSMMKDLQKEGNSLYGRFAAVISLKELSYKEAAGFYMGKSPYDRIAFFSVFGGSPYINEQLDPAASLKENIVKTILNENSAIYIYADNLLLSDYTNRINVEKICYALGNGRKRYGEIEAALKIAKNGNLHKQLSVLIDMELIKKENPINRLQDPKKSMYEINDNLLRFFFKYIYRNKSALQMLGGDTFFDEYIQNDLTTFISHRFEEICRTYFAGLASSGKLQGIKNIGSFYYDDPVQKQNGEFDIALQYGKTLNIYEAKFYKDMMPVSEIHKEVEQIRNIPGIQVDQIGFIAVNGFEKKEKGYSYITGEQLYK